MELSSTMKDAIALPHLFSILNLGVFVLKDKFWWVRLVSYAQMVPQRILNKQNVRTVTLDISAIMKDALLVILAVPEHFVQMITLCACLVNLVLTTR